MAVPESENGTRERSAAPESPPSRHECLEILLLIVTHTPTAHLSV